VVLSASCCRSISDWLPYLWINFKIFSTSKNLIDDLHEILIKMGESGSISTYQHKDRKIIDKKYIKNI